MNINIIFNTLINILLNPSLETKVILSKLRAVIGDNFLENYEHIISSNEVTARKDLLENVKKQVIFYLDEIIRDLSERVDKLRLEIQPLTVNNLDIFLETISNIEVTEIVNSRDENLKYETVKKVVELQTKLNNLAKQPILDCNIEEKVENYNIINQLVKNYLEEYGRDELMFITELEPVEETLIDTSEDMIDLAIDLGDSLDKFNSIVSNYSSSLDKIVKNDIVDEFKEVIGDANYKYFEGIINLEDYKNRLGFLVNVFKLYIDNHNRIITRLGLLSSVVVDMEITFKDLSYSIDKYLHEVKIILEQEVKKDS